MVTASSVQIHEEYNRETLENDICIVKFPSSRLNNLIAPACLPATRQHPPAGTLCWAAGWGKMAEGGRNAVVLNEVDLRIISDSVCRRTENKNDFFPGKMFCAGYLEGNCFGFSDNNGTDVNC